jgi:hypothetical protein
MKRAALVILLLAVTFFCDKTFAQNDNKTENGSLMIEQADSNMAAFIESEMKKLEEMEMKNEQSIQQLIQLRHEIIGYKKALIMLYNKKLFNRDTIRNKEQKYGDK